MFAGPTIIEASCRHTADLPVSSPAHLTLLTPSHTQDVIIRPRAVITRTIPGTGRHSWTPAVSQIIPDHLLFRLRRRCRRPRDPPSYTTARGSGHIPAVPGLHGRTGPYRAVPGRTGPYRAIPGRPGRTTPGLLAAE